jgi:hypothetical protein
MWWGVDNVVTLKPVVPGPRIDGYRGDPGRALMVRRTIIVNGLMRVRPGVTVSRR